MEPPNTQAVSLSPTQLNTSILQTSREDRTGTDPSPDVVPKKIKKEQTVSQH